MEDLQEIKQDVREIKADLKEVSSVLLRNTISLEVHEKRTTLAEKRLDAHDAYRKWEVGLIISIIASIAIKLLFR